MSPETLEPELDRLYALPLGEFIGARNELAKTLRAGGERAAADEVKKLVKPSVTAWAVNALYHHERQTFEALSESAAAVRAALAGEGDRRKAEAARRQALQRLLKRAAKLLAEAGHAATPANRQRISHTLEALTATDPTADGPRPGRLTADLELQGFDVLAGLAASLAPAPAAGAAAPAGKRTQGRPKRGASPAAVARDERREAARRKVAELEAALAQLEADAEEAETTAVAAAGRYERLTEEAAEARRRASEATKAAGAAKEELAGARAAATKARAARRRGLSRLETARRRLARQSV